MGWTKSKFYFLFFILLFCGFFTAFYKTHADVIQSDSSVSTIYNYPSDGIGVGHFYKHLGKNFSGTLTQVDWYSSSINYDNYNTATAYAYFALFRCVNGTFTYSGGSNHCSSGSYYSVMSRNVSTGAHATKTLYSATSADYANDWDGVMSPNDDFFANFGQTDWYGSSSGAIWGGYSVPALDDSSLTTTIQVPYFYFHGVNHSEPYIPPSISLIFPPNNSTVNGDFTHWQSSSTFSTSTNAYIKINYGVSSSSLNFSDTTSNFFVFGNFGSSTVDYIPKSNFLNGFYYAQAEIRSATSSQVLATSTTIYFEVGGLSTIFTGQPAYPTPTSTTSVASSTINCSGEGLIAGSFCSVITWLFVPSQSAISGITSVWSVIENKPPIGYFTATITSLQSISTSTSAYTMPDLSTLDTGFFYKIRTAFSIIFWFMFSFWIFNRIRHFSFTNP